MIPHKTKRGAAALANLKVYEGVPPPYDKMKRRVIPDAIKYLPLFLSSDIHKDKQPYLDVMQCIIDVDVYVCLLVMCRALRLQPGHRYCLLGGLSKEVGWNHHDTIKVLLILKKIIYNMLLPIIGT